MAAIYGRILQDHPLGQLVGFVGNSPGKCRDLEARFRVPAYPGGEYQRLLSGHELDAVIVATPEWVRDAPLQLASDAMFHLLIEKPVADTWLLSKQLIGRLRGYPRVVRFCHVLRFSPRFAALKAGVDRGAVGDLRHISSRRNSNRMRAARVVGRTDLAFWLTPHDIDMMRWVTGSEVESVYSLSRGALDSTDDYVVSALRFTNGVTATAEVSWCTPPLSSSAREAAFEVRGTNGVISLDDSAMNVEIFSAGDQVTAEDTYEAFEVAGQPQGFFRNLADDFLLTVSRGEASDAALTDAMEVARVSEMIRRSVGRRAEVSRAEVE
jgi:predicted dehydrogenase